MSFADADALLNAVMARANEAGAGAEASPAGIEQLFSQMMGIAMEEIQKAKQNNARIPQSAFQDGYDAMLAGIDTSDNPRLAKVIADYRAARTEEERVAIKPILAKALEQSAEEAERRAFGILNGTVSVEDDTEDVDDDDDSEQNYEEPKKCSRFLDCNCDNSERPFNQLLHDFTDDAIEYALMEAEANPHLVNIKNVKPLSDRKRVDYLKDYIEKERVAIVDIIRKFIEEGCCGFAWQFLIDLPAFREEIPKYYKCRFPQSDANECMVCVCYIHNQGWIGKVQHPDLVPMEHYLGVMIKLVAEANQTQDITNLTIVYDHFKRMRNFAHYHKMLRDSISQTPIIKNRLIKKWFKKH